MSNKISVSSSDDDNAKPPRPGNVVDGKYAGLRVLTFDDIPKAAETLLQAFSFDSLAKLLVCDLDGHQLKRDFEFNLYSAYLHQHISKGICLGINEHDDHFETVAIWSVPDSIERGLEEFSTLMEAGYGKLWHMGVSETRNKLFYGMLPLLHDTCARILSTDSRFKNKGIYTLVYLGSTKDARGKGNSRKMFDYMFENHIDVPNTKNIAYLESSAVSNIPIYERFGFKFYEDIVLGTKTETSVEGDDFAVMNVMIRDSFAHDWTQDSYTPVSKF